LFTPVCLVSSRIGRVWWLLATCACAVFAFIPSCRSDDIQVSLLAIVRENAFELSRYKPIRLTFFLLCINKIIIMADRRVTCRNRTLAGGGAPIPSNAHWPVTWSHINTTIQLSFSMIHLLLLWLATARVPSIKSSHLTLLNKSFNVY